MNTRAKVVGGSKATSKGQTTIPKQVREVMGIKDGTPLTWTYEDGELTVRAKTRRLEDFVPLVPPNGRHATVEEMEEAIGDAIVERVQRSFGR
ncbi:AbrB/MazE/SpoVT family DNA-binding domain-containing protein [Devosia sp. PTR5]|uniref:AbrB/MazE/SpoVT family DNA-binding domain-containing protein n=1 Tax=Devosia oryzisoli TaxID=2774138 RepID=A0A927FXS3_9HYPH|nr:AbrB/MazE/SpoVT family DNA-binding domain-containing protein [Devosia oryzisoli]MBD8066878.1 AbrB/MazE/SpoVT family DNA-binding domain-containing protein [Devosia oryzisoli]